MFQKLHNTIQKVTKLKLLLLISLLINILFMALVGIYLYTPYLDWAVLVKSGPSFCDFITKVDKTFLDSEGRVQFCDLMWEIRREQGN